MVFFATRFPLNTKVNGWTSTPRFSTTIIVGANGQESRNANWQDGLLAFNAAFAVRNLADSQLLRDFFWVCRGKERSFLLKDWGDYELNQGLHGEIPADGVRTQFQIFKIYQNALGNYIRRDITKPVSGTVVVTVTNPPQTISNSTSLTTGIITFATPPVSGSHISVQCEFDVPTRFDIDELPVTFFRYWLVGADDRAQANLPEIPMVEVRGE